MIDAITQKPLRVSTESPALPYIEVPFSQLDEVRRLFDSHGVRYRVSENVISFNGAPEVTYINFPRGTDAAAVQAVLDGVR